MAEQHLRRSEIVEMTEEELLGEYERFADYHQRKADAQKEAMRRK